MVSECCSIRATITSSQGNIFSEFRMATPFRPETAIFTFACTQPKITQTASLLLPTDFDLRGIERILWRPREALLRGIWTSFKSCSRSAIDDYQIFRGDLIDRWLRFEGRDHPDAKALRAAHFDTFCPRDISWRRLVEVRGPELIDQPLAGAAGCEGTGMNDGKAVECLERMASRLTEAQRVKASVQYSGLAGRDLRDRSEL